MVKISVSKAFTKTKYLKKAKTFVCAYYKDFVRQKKVK